MLQKRNHDFTERYPNIKAGTYDTLGSKSFDYQFMATVDWRGHGIQNEGDNKRGEKGIPELSLY